MNNKKGFTLVELLVVLAILALLAIIAIPMISRYVKKGNDKYYESLNNQLLIIGKDYYIENRKELPRGQLNAEGEPIYFSKVFLKDLEEQNFVTNDVVDKDGNACSNSYVTVENVNGEYKYQSCLICNGTNYSKENIYCNIEDGGSGGDISSDEEIPTCDFAYGEYDLDNWINDDILITINGYDNSGINFFRMGLNGEEKQAINTNDVYWANYSLTSSGNSSHIFYVFDQALNMGACTTNIIKIDKIKPLINLNNTDIIPTTINKDNTIIIPIKITDIHSGITTTSFDENDITVKVGTTIVTPTTKELEYKSFSNGIYSYELTLKGIVGNGALTLEIAANNVLDIAGNGNITTTITPEVSIDNSERPVCTWTNVSTPLRIKFGQSVIYTLECVATSKFSDSTIVTSDLSYIKSNVFDLNNATITSTKISDYKYIYEITVSALNVSGGYSNIVLNANAVSDIFNNQNISTVSQTQIGVNNVKPRVGFHGPYVTPLTTEDCTCISNKLDDRDNTSETGASCLTAKTTATVINNGDYIYYVVYAYDLNGFGYEDYGDSNNKLTWNDVTIPSSTYLTNWYNVASCKKDDMSIDNVYIYRATGSNGNGNVNLTLSADKVMDTYGNTNLSVSSSKVLIDNLAPICVFSNPSSLSIYVGSSVTYTLQCTDASGIIGGSYTAANMKSALQTSGGLLINNVTRTGNNTNYVYTITAEAIRVPSGNIYLPANTLWDNFSQQNAQSTSPSVTILKSGGGEVILQ